MFLHVPSYRLTLVEVWEQYGSNVVISKIYSIHNTNMQSVASCSFRSAGMKRIALEVFCGRLYNLLRPVYTGDTCRSNSMQLLSR